jgi:hypothetical protein
MALTTACGSKGAVSLGARVDNATVSARTVALGTQVSGAFDLVLELGSAASKATSVEFGAFSIKGQSGVLIEALSLSSSEAFPISLGPGEGKSVHVSIEDGELVDDASKAALCAGDVWYAGVVTDTLSNGQATPATSDKLKPTCE